MYGTNICIIVVPCITQYFILDYINDCIFMNAPIVILNPFHIFASSLIYIHNESTNYR